MVSSPWDDDGDGDDLTAARVVAEPPDVMR
jgi:hypothetical protein